MSGSAGTVRSDSSCEFADRSAAAGGAVGVSVAGPADTAAWNAYVRGNARAELYHDARWRKLIEETFRHEGHYFMARAVDGTVCGVLPTVELNSRLFGRFLVSMPYFNYGGLLADNPDAARALLGAVESRARELGVAHVELRHRGDADLTWRSRDDKASLSLELPNSEEALWQQFKPKLRAQIRRPEKEGAIAAVGGADLLDDFYAVFSRNMRDLGTPVYPRRFFAAILREFDAESRVHVVRLGREPVAAGIVLGHRDTAEIPWASSLREANRFSVNMLLYRSALGDAIRRGFHRFDFGRSSKDSGPYRFKLQWGAQPEPLRWHYWMADGGDLPMINPDNPKYAMAIGLWKRLPLPIANVLGPMIVRSIP